MVHRVRQHSKPCPSICVERTSRRRCRFAIGLVTGRRGRHRHGCARMITLYHNPRCSKSRQALAMCDASPKEVVVHLYLSNPLSKDEIHSVLSRFQGTLKSAIRMKDPKFKTVDASSLDPTNIESVVEFLTKHGHLMERPLLDTGVISCVGRPVDLLQPHL